MVSPWVSVKLKELGVEGEAGEEGAFGFFGLESLKFRLKPERKIGLPSPYRLSQAMGWPMECMWMRIWWVRPVWIRNWRSE